MKLNEEIKEQVDKFNRLEIKEIELLNLKEKIK